MFFSKTILADERCYNECTYIDQMQYRRINYYLDKYNPGKTGSIILIGAMKSVVEVVENKYPSLRVASLDFTDKQNWKITAENQSWNNSFDWAFAFHVLEKESDRVGLVKMFYKLLKSDGRAVIYCDSSDEDTFDTRLERLINNSKWRNRIQVTQGLTLSQYADIVEGAGFSIVERNKSCWCLGYYSTNHFRWWGGLWVCDRMDLPYYYANEFIEEFGNALLVSNRFIDHHFPTHVFILEKR